MGKARTLLEDGAGSTPSGPARVDGLMVLAEVRGQSEGHLIATELLLRALAEPGIDGRQEATILASLAQNASVDGQTGMAADYAEAALALAEDLGDRTLLVYCLTVYADVTFWRTGRLCRDVLDRAIALHQEVPRRPERRSAVDARPQPRSGRTLRGVTGALGGRSSPKATARDDPDVAAQLFFLARMEVGAGRWDHVADICARGHGPRPADRTRGRRSRSAG